MRLFIHCLLKANVKTKKWQGYTIKRGSFITSLAHLSKELKLSMQQIRTAISKLELTKEITKIQQGSNTLIIVNNYNEYQPSNKENNNVITTEQQTNNKLITTTLNCKNDKNVISLYQKQITEREREILYSYCKRQKIKNKNAFIRKLVDNGDYVYVVDEELKHQNYIEKLKKEKLQNKQNEIVEDPAITEQAYLKFRETFTNRRSGNDTMGKSIGNVEN
jgi:hypothetical protein